MNEKKVKTTKKTKWLSVAVLAMVILGLSAVVFQKSSFFKFQTNAEIDMLESKIDHLEKLIKSYQREKSVISEQDVLRLNEKVDLMVQTNQEILETKASLASVMGVVERVDTLEKEVKRLGAVSSQGALVLTAAGLVEDVAKKGESFVYEASVLKILSENTPMEESAQIIDRIAKKGMLSKNQLIKKFTELYKKDSVEVKAVETEGKAETTQNWMDKIREKLKSMVIVETIKTEDEEKAGDEVLRLVQNGDFETAILKMNAEPKYQTEQFEVWIENVRVKKVFDQEIAKIKALTLGVMKTENIK